MKWIALILVALVATVSSADASVSAAAGGGVGGIAGGGGVGGGERAPDPWGHVSPTCVDSGGTTRGWTVSDKLDGCSGFCPGEDRCEIRMSMRGPSDPGWVEGAKLIMFCGCDPEGPHPCCHLVTQETLFINTTGAVVYNPNGFTLKAEGSCPACGATGVCKMAAISLNKFQAVCK